MRILIFSILVFLFSPFTLKAFANTPKGAVTVAPSIIKLDLQQDKPQAALTYTNNTDKDIEISLSASDFKELEDGYKVSYLEGKDAKNYKYALSFWIDFNKKNLSLGPGQKEEVKILINNKALTPGGHYATILANISLKNRTSDNVALQGVLSSLLFVRTNTGKEFERAKIQSHEPVRSLFDFPDKYSFWFQNSGDTDLTPYGLIELKDLFGRTVAQGIINDGSLITLPESIRRYDIPLKKTTPFLFPGIYHTTISIHFGKTDQKILSSSIFFSQGSIPLIPLVAILIISGFIYYKKSKKTN